MITKAAGTPMTEAQMNYLISLIGKAHSTTPQARTSALLKAAGCDFNAASSMIDFYKAVLNATPAAAPVAAVHADLAYEAPVGHYWVNGQHVWLKKGKYGGATLDVGGKWYGSITTQKAIVWLNEHLGSQSVALACVLEYAKVTSKCGVCNTKLSDPKSIAAGIGPTCAKKYGYKI